MGESGLWSSTQDRDTFTFAEIAQWLRDTGFSNVRQ